MGAGGHGAVGPLVLLFVETVPLAGSESATLPHLLTEETPVLEVWEVTLNLELVI